MYRYFAVAWNTQDAEQSTLARTITRELKERVPVLEQVYSAAGLTVFSATDPRGVYQPYLLHHKAGVVIGRLFSRELYEETPPQPIVFDEISSRRVLKSEGRALIEEYWGRYVAFIHNESTYHSWILPDPTGGVSCYTVSYQGLTLSFSNLNDCIALQRVRLTINWKYLATRFMHVTPALRDTGLCEVQRIVPSECVVLQAGRETQRPLYWDLVTLARDKVLEDRETARQLVRSTLRACSNAWAHQYPSMLLSLSGGVDSSILMATLARAPACQHLSAVNYFNDSAAGDERRFARLVVEKCRAVSGRDIDYFEYDFDKVYTDLRSLLPVRADPIPEPSIGPGFRRADQLQWLRKRNAAMCDGVGGDAVFLSPSETPPGADYVHRYGLDKHFLTLALANTRHGFSFGEVLKHMLRARLSKKSHRYQPELGEGEILESEVIANVTASASEYLMPLWLQPCYWEHASTLPSSKLLHLDAMYRPYRRVDAFGEQGEIEFVSPILDQPIIELFARIPTYLLAENGRARVLARRAFENDLPRELFLRRSKGYGNSIMLHIFNTNYAFLRELILDGQLLKHRILDPLKIKPLVDNRIEGNSAIFSKLVMAGEMEIWLQQWNQTIQGLEKIAA